MAAKEELSEGLNPVAAKLYEQLKSNRSPFLMRARDCAKYTIPTLIPPFDGSTNTNAYQYPTPWQSMGARGVNNLAAKLLMALFPPNTPFFQLEIDDQTLAELAGTPDMQSKVLEGLNKIERAVQTNIEQGAVRISAFGALKQLVVTGNVLLHLPEGGGMRSFQLDRYVVQRDAVGDVLDIVIVEDLAPATLSKELQAFLGYDVEAEEEDGDTKISRTQTISLYTHVSREEDTWEVYQEMNGKMVPDSFGTYPLDKTPWIPVRFSKCENEDYGRSYVEEYLGDIKSLDGLSQAIVEGSAVAAKTVFLVNPNGTTDPLSLTKASNGAVIAGTEKDVTVLGLNKYNDFRVALETMKDINERLSYAFLLNSSVQRSGDRVTAEEIRYMAQELETALGGIYSILSQELQLPLVQRIMFVMERAKKLPVLPKGTVKPVIVTGMEALGRGNDLNKLQQFLSILNQTIGAQAMMERLNVGDAITRVGTSLGIDTVGLVKTDQEVQAAQQAAAQAQQQQAQMAMMHQAVAPAVNQAGGILKQRMAHADNQEAAAQAPQAQAA